MTGTQRLVALTAATWPAFGLSLLLLAVASVGWISGDTLVERTVIKFLIYVIAVVGLYVFIGNTGIMSFGSVAFMAIGAYASAWQTCCPKLKPFTMRGLPEFLRDQTYPILPAALTSIALAVVVAALIGIPIMRLSGIAAAIATLAFFMVIYVTYSNWDSVTLGTSSTVGLPLYVDVTVAFVCAVIAVWIAFAYQSSRFGVIVRAGAQDEVAARAGGINLPRQRLIAWSIGAGIMTLAGILFGHYLGVININNFYLNMTLITLAMLVIGGMKSLTGAVVGALSVNALLELLRMIEQGVTLGSVTVQAPAGFAEVGLGILMVIIVIRRPAGITGGAELPWPFRPSRSPNVSREYDANDR